MKRLGALLGLMTVAGCATAPAPACPAGQEHLRTAQLFLGQKAGGPQVGPGDLARFIDQEVTPRFPDGVTVLDGGGQWQGSENQLIREAVKVVMIVLPPASDAKRRVDQVREAYKTRFQQDSVLVTQASCVEV